MMMHKAVHPRDDIERIYVSTKEKVKRLSFEDYVEVLIQRSVKCTKRLKTDSFQRLVVAMAT